MLVCYKEENIFKYENIPNESYLDRFTNIIKIYKVEEIISTCVGFDSIYKRLKYFHVDDLCFIKFLIDGGYHEMFESSDDYKKIEKYFTSLY